MKTEIQPASAACPTESRDALTFMRWAVRAAGGSWGAGRLPFDVLVITPSVHDRTRIPLGVGALSVSGKEASTMLVDAPVSTIMSRGSSPARRANWLVAVVGWMGLEIPRGSRC